MPDRWPDQMSMASLTTGRTSLRSRRTPSRLGSTKPMVSDEHSIPRPMPGAPPVMEASRRGDQRSTSGGRSQFATAFQRELSRRNSFWSVRSDPVLGDQATETFRSISAIPIPYAASLCRSAQTVITGIRSGTSPSTTNGQSKRPVPPRVDRIPCLHRSEPAPGGRLLQAADSMATVSAAHRR